MLDDAIAGARFLVGLPALLRHRVDPAGARRTATARLERRASDFLALARRAIYDNRGSPYRPLLAQAGCAFPDLQRLVEHDGLEAALRTLLARGVYLTGDECKGRRPVHRGSVRLPVATRQLRNPLAQAQLTVRTSGSRGPRTRVPIDFAFLRERAVNDTLALSLIGADLSAAIWKVPGGDALGTLLRMTACGAVPRRWFSQIDPDARDLDARYGWSARLLRFGGRLAGVRLPRPEHAGPDDPGAVLRWLTACLREGRTPLLQTYVSSAVRACQAALEAGIDVRGARFMVGGEPLTDARADVIRRATGCRPQPRYASGEAGLIGLGCLRPEAPDDVHVFQDLNALVHADAPVEALPADALFVTSIRSTAPLMLLNVSLGDVGVLASRTCGCGLDAVGWSTHLHTIRSHDKLTAAGMTFLDVDVIRVLEEVLPARFGGAPTDYQIVEDETEDGRPRLRLLVRPGVGTIAAAAVRDAFLAAIGEEAGAGGRVMGRVWREGELLQVERRAPVATASGKILHLHVARGRAVGRPPAPDDDTPPPPG